MPKKFSVEITSDDAVAAAKALDAASIPHYGPIFTGFVETSNSWMVGPTVTAVVEAGDAGVARKRVIDVIGPTGEVAQANPYGD